MKFNIENYPGKYVMHCKTKEEARSFCDYLKSIGRAWCTGRSYDDISWGYYGANTIYCFNSGTLSDVNFAKSQNYTILEWEDFMNKTFTKADLKTGDIIKRRNGSTEIVILELDVCVCKKGFNRLSSINNDLTYDRYDQSDVVAVRRPKNANQCQFAAFDLELGDIVYDRERDSVVEMTMEEICAALGKTIKIVKEK